MKNTLSLLVFVFVASLVFGGAYYSLQLSFKKDTNVELLAQVFNSRSKATLLAQSMGQGAVLASHSEGDCPLNDLTLLQSVSVVDFMVALGEDYRFENRVKLASNYNITNYTGKGEQNLKLLTMLRQDSGCFTAKNK
jgi:hypothetical protein